MSVISGWLIAYLIGSLSFAVIVSKCFGLPDPRTRGSKNAGATNVARNYGLKLGLLVLLSDGAKGAVAVYLAIHSGLSGGALAGVGCAVVLGHLFPCFYQFRGGKGVATAAGVLAALHGLLFAVVALIFAAVVLLTRYVSLASMVAAMAAPLGAAWLNLTAYVLPLLIMAVLIVIQHRSNIQRLRARQEPKI